MPGPPPRPPRTKPSKPAASKANLLGLALEFNPPTVDWQRGGYNQRRGRLDSSSRDTVFGVDNVPLDTTTGGNRAYMVQAVEKAADWVTTQSATDGKSTIPPGTSLLKGKRYGFQFHYNPVQVDFTMGLSGEVDLALITSQTTKATPWAPSDNPPMVSMNITLNRVEDMNILTKDGTIRGDVATFYRDPYGGRVDSTMGKEIYERGTGIDLEYLFRCVMGRPYDTRLRGNTADIGIMYSLPQYLILNKRMWYSGRLTGIQYQHMMFVRDLVPVYTVLNLSFERYPDAVSSGIGGARNYAVDIDKYRPMTGVGDFARGTSGGGDFSDFDIGSYGGGDFR